MAIIDDAPNTTAHDGARASSVARRLAFFAFAALIYLGPAPGQLFGQHNPLLREWVMFSGVGVGILDGTFTVVEQDGIIRRLTPLEAAHLDAYPVIIPYNFEGLVTEAADLARLAQPLCDETAETGAVSYDGFVGTREGWRPLRADDICTRGTGAP